MQVSRRHIVFVPFFIFLFFYFSMHFAYGLRESERIHFSGDRQLWDRKNNQVEIRGNATVSQVGETITADFIQLDLDSRDLHAKGNCIYVITDSVILGEEMFFNLNTNNGIILNGKISNDSFSLMGQRIEKLSFGKFKIYDGEYTTCHDCSSSWSLQAEKVDLSLGKYAILSNTIARIKGAPVMWLPFLAFPVKSERESGFLQPKFGKSTTDGFKFILPYFWAMNRSFDMTLGAGRYTKKGSRFEWETRYVTSDRNKGDSNFYLIQDKSSFFTQYAGIAKYRFALDLSQTQELSFGFEEKLRLLEVSDNLYPFPYHLGADIPRANQEAFLSSSLIFSRSSSDVSGFLLFRRSRNLLNSTAGDIQAQALNFDSKTVQVYPSLFVTAQDHFLWNSPFIGGVSFGVSNFTRTAGAFDYDHTSVAFGKPVLEAIPFRPGYDPIRKATRFSITPLIYTTVRPFDLFSVVPSLQYRHSFYDFKNKIPNLSRGYLLFQTDLSTQIERIFEFSEGNQSSKVKHLIRPQITYSLIPYIQEDLSNPFVEQMKQLRRPSFRPGYNFDDSDIIPYSYQSTTANYFIPLGNSLSYGFTTQWIKKKGTQSENQIVAEWSVGHGLNFLELHSPEGNPERDPARRHLLTRFFSEFKLNQEHVNSDTVYYYYPDTFPIQNRHTLSTSVTYIFERSMHQKVLTFDRSLALGYSYNRINGNTSNLRTKLNFSVNDYFLPSASVSYSFADKVPVLLDASFELAFQSSSRCWKVAILSSFAPPSSGSPASISTSFDLSLNFSGQGFGGVTEMVNQQR